MTGTGRAFVGGGTLYYAPNRALLAFLPFGALLALPLLGVLVATGRTCEKIRRGTDAGSSPLGGVVVVAGPRWALESNVRAAP